MMNVRLKFTKGNEVKYISHLDLMRTFQRAIRRTDIPVAYSAGFNPHQEISFGAPLSLGVVSNAEYIDIKLAEDMDIKELQRRLNGSMPAGISITGGAVLPEHAKSAMAIVTHARYNIRLIVEGIDKQRLDKAIEDFLKQEQINVMKEQPKKEFKLKEIDIKPMIITMDNIDSKGDEYFLECLLQSGSKANLKPELLVVAFKDYTGYNIKGVRIVREELYAEKDGKLLDLLEYEKR
ncbi:MAG: TIGR03936 family radical SAM-associated protein [Caulobacteraceae bacterium]